MVLNFYHRHHWRHRCKCLTEKTIRLSVKISLRRWSPLPDISHIVRLGKEVYKRPYMLNAVKEQLLNATNL